jgi:hypothetical protein
MKQKLILGGFVVVLVYGVWLAFQPRDGAIYSSWNCAGSRALICIQK